MDCARVMRPSTKSVRFRLSTTASENSSTDGSPLPPHADATRPRARSSTRRRRGAVKGRALSDDRRFLDERAAGRKRATGPDHAEDRLLLLEDVARRVQRLLPFEASERA